MGTPKDPIPTSGLILRIQGFYVLKKCTYVRNFNGIQKVTVQKEWGAFDWSESTVGQINARLQTETSNLQLSRWTPSEHDVIFQTAKLNQLVDVRVSIYENKIVLS